MKCKAKKHDTVSAYYNYGCRCPVAVQLGNQSLREARARKAFNKRRLAEQLYQSYQGQNNG